MTNGLLELDERLTARLRIAERPGSLRNLAAVLAHSGDSWFWIVVLALVWWFGDQAWRWRAKVLLGGDFDRRNIGVCTQVYNTATTPRGPVG